MKHTLVFCLIVLLASAVMAADFSGTWVLNQEKSQLGEGFGGRMAAKKMVVAQKDNALKIESTREGRDGGERVSTDELTLDGKEVKSSGERGETIATAKVDGETLLIKTVRKFERDGQTFESTTSQTWKMDGKALIIDSKSESQRGTREMKLVYDKQS